MPETPQLARKNTAGDPGLVVAPSGASEGWRPQNNLPLELTGLVERKREIVGIKGMLSEQRLLTLTGPGGSGKTRLAVASRLVEIFQAGAWVAELAPLSDPELVPQALAQALGVRETPGPALADSMRAHLQARETLLILVNCEHLVEASASLAGVLLRSPSAQTAAPAAPPLTTPGPRTPERTTCRTSRRRALRRPYLARRPSRAR